MRVCIIPAKGTSSRIPHKNIRLLYGRPIIAYSIKTALESGLFGAVYVSSDSAEVLTIARENGAIPLRRPEGYVGEDTGPIDVTRVELKRLTKNRASFACCLTATAPLLQAANLRWGLQLLKRYGADYAFGIGTEPTMHDAGAFYWGKVEAFLERRPIFGPDSLMIPLPADQVCDINTEADWQRAEAMYAALHRVAA